jgi:uncharacterized protein
MPEIKTPGVYIEEKNAFPESVIRVPTAVPAFIGYTQKITRNGQSLLHRPVRVSSLREFVEIFGSAPVTRFAIQERPGRSKKAAAFSFLKRDYLLVPQSMNFLLHRCIQLFYENGGGTCYVVCVGGYDAAIDAHALVKGLGVLEKEREPAIVVIPEATQLMQSACIDVQKAALLHCAETMKNRVAILDIHDGDKPLDDSKGDCIERFRSAIGMHGLGYGVAYYPWLNSAVVDVYELGPANIANPAVLQQLLREELQLPVKADGSESDQVRFLIETLNKLDMAEGVLSGDASSALDELNKLLLAISPLYKTIMESIADRLNLLPPGAAVAGLYAMVDNETGVWKAPANVGLVDVISPSTLITDEQQQGLNVSPTGKSINAIRLFAERGTLVWGGRTLDGNSTEWRYISVRRTAIMIEESIRNTLGALVFEPNDANTWQTIKTLVSNFLSDIWKEGGLAGSAPDDAFSVSCGLGETMTPQDILDGVMRVSLMIAILRPAEFIPITIEQRMQTA